MTSLPKVRTLWILGVMLVCLGALFHSHAESWATSVFSPDYAPTQKIGVVDYPLKNLFQDGGIAIMGFGAIAFTVGLVGWVYPARDH